MPVTVRVSPRLVLATAVVAVALPLGAARLLGGPDYRVDGPAPESITVGGTHAVLAGQEPMLGVAAVTGSRVVVDVGSPVGCTDARVRIVRQDDRVVRLAAYGYLADGAPADASCAGQVAVDLGAPLGGRRVVEEGTDHVLRTGTQD